MSNSFAGRRWAALAGAAIATHAALFVALHVLEPQVSPLRGIIADYQATGSSGLVRASFVAFALAWGALGIGLSGAGGNAKLLSAGRVLFLLAAIALVFAAVYPESADPRTGSTLARVQNLVARPGLFLGIVLVSLGLSRITAWGDLAPTLISISVGSAVLLVATIGILLDLGFGGLSQRVIFVLMYAWVILVGRRLALMAGSPAIQRTSGGRRHPLER